MAEVALHSPSQAQAVLSSPRAALHKLAEDLGIAVRVEPFELRMAGKGGVCKIGGRYVVLIDAKLPIVEQIGVLGEALGKVVPRGFDVPEALRPYLRTGHGAVGKLLRPRPLARVRSLGPL